MYIAELDRPWTDTPFMFQGFVLGNEQQLDALKKYCSTVIVDVERSVPTEPAAVLRIAYPQKVPVEVEFRPARQAHKNSRVLIREIIAAARIGRTLDAERVKSAVTSMTESVLRNPDALLLFSQLRAKGEYAESHAADVSIYMITFGRFLQLEPAQIEFLGYLGLLHHIAKLPLPKHLPHHRAPPPLP